MRIALNAWFIDQPATGSGQYLTHLLAQLAVRHPQHQYLLCQPKVRYSHPGPSSYGSHNTLGPCFEPVALATPFDVISHNLAKVWFEQVSFPQACRRWHAEIGHVPYWGSPLFSSAPTLVTIHDLIPALLPAYRGGALGWLYTQLVSLSARRAAYVLTDSHASSQDINRHLKVPEGHIEAIYLAAENGCKPATAESGRPARTKYALPDQYLLYLGGFDVRKNVPSLLRAFAELDLPHVQLVVAGRLPERDTLFTPDPRRIVQELGIESRVCFSGWIEEEDKPAIYRGALAALFVSQYEGFGLPALEAMACGTPVVASSRGSLPEVVGAGGICVNPDDRMALTQAMHAIVQDRLLRERLGAAALEQARRFTWARTADATMEVYRRAVSGHA